MSIVYDYEVVPGHDDLVELFERGNTLAVESLTPETASVIAAFPFRKYQVTSRAGNVSSRITTHSPQLARMAPRFCLQTERAHFHRLRYTNGRSAL